MISAVVGDLDKANAIFVRDNEVFYISSSLQTKLRLLIISKCWTSYLNYPQVRTSDKLNADIGIHHFKEDAQFAWGWVKYRSRHVNFVNGIQIFE